MGPYFLNFYCKKLIDNPYYTICNLKDKPDWDEMVNNRIVIDSKSMEFHFVVNPSANTIMLEKIKVKIFLGQNSEDSTKVPAHFYGELVKTRKGIKLLKEKGYF